ncbi:IucA/IucC family protein [Breoghania sp.]|uniref:IucA/IucC family protein n=1 Tax=Breoghania sp. TaxID=2065378 RepID=UPI002AA65D8B|nr:IucA/IucC family protein [Breoghania sp.]
MTDLLEKEPGATKQPDRDVEAADWKTVCRASLAKLLSELSYEEVISLRQISEGHFRLDLQSGVSYRMEGWTGIWDNIWVDGGTIVREPEEDGSPFPSPLRFVVDARAEMAMAPETEAMFVRELSNTLRQDLVLLRKNRQVGGRQLAIEPAHVRHALLEGHPKAVANKGRLGWGVQDLQDFAPENRSPIRLVWLAADRRQCRIGESPELDERGILEETLGPEETGRFLGAMEAQGLSLATHTLIPVHPWQWDHVVQQAYVAELMERRLVWLGSFGGRYVAGPSLRTLTSLDRPGSPDIKLAMTILNTSAWRGIPGKFIALGGAISDWLSGLVAGDSVLENTVIILREQRGIWYRHPIYERMPDAPYQHHETLGAIWREAAASRIGGNRQACLYAALLHLDNEGMPLAVHHAARAGMTIREWLRDLFQVTVVPLYHFLAKYGVGFIAHGQNLTVIMEDHRPVGLAIKDLQGDVDLVDRVFPEHAGMPAEIRRTLAAKPPAHIVHDIQTAHFVTVLRFFSARLQACGAMGEREFYTLLAETLQGYMQEHIDLRDRFALFDLFSPELPRVCINKVRFDIGYGDAARRPLPALGSNLPNPLHIAAQVSPGPHTAPTAD